jgi:branched-chain amino acid transport system substrate-binding protein
MLKQLINSLFDGLLLGVVYGMIAMGLNLIWGVMHVINMAHGAVMTLGMFGAYGLFLLWSISPYASFPLLAGGGLLLGMGVYWIAVHRVIDRAELLSLLTTFAVNMILVGAGTAIFTSTPRNIDYTLGSLHFGQLTLSGSRLVAAAVAAALSLAVSGFLSRTFLGKCIRAVADNRAAAELMGIPTSRVLAITFGIGTMLALVSGLLIATVFPFNVLSGDGYQTKAFVVCVLGGLGHPIGALVGGVILGGIEGLIPCVLPISTVAMIEFLLFVLILLLRPTGLFGGKQ